MSHEILFKKLIWKFSRKLTREIFRGWLLAKLLAKLFAGKSYSQNSRKNLCQIFITELYSRNFSRVSLTRENTHKTCFSLKNNLKIFEKHGWYKSLPKANKNIFGLIHIWLSTYTSHLNIYNHINEIGIHWTLNLCVVCVDQVWNSP